MPEVQRDTIGSREDTLRFIELVSLFQTQAMMALGKLANPVTGKAERNLDAARVFIDTLEMLERKTAGNLNAEELRLLRTALTDLRLMYVEEARTPVESSSPTAGTPEAAQSSGASSDASSASEPRESKVKFHKSYG
ncbi:MAG: DUF1844 domain-containing protein [Verrucomicrobiae bacterium]|nr:DUF1844 domain-containing protein [Verrucomicrobiae bacterium]